MVFCRGLKIQTSVERIIHIWRERRVFEEEYLNELDNILGTCTCIFITLSSCDSYVCIESKNVAAQSEKIDFKVSSIYSHAIHAVTILVLTIVIFLYGGLGNWVTLLCVYVFLYSMCVQISLLEDSLVELGKFEGEMKIKSTALSQLPIDVSSTSSLSKLKGITKSLILHSFLSF